MKYSTIWTFNADEPWDGRGYHIGTTTKELAYITGIQNSHVPLPNIGIPACQTLLAERLRTGKPMTERDSAEWAAFKGKTAQYMPEGKGAMKQAIFRRKELVGKTIGIEIEYYPKEVLVTRPDAYGRSRPRPTYPVPAENALTQVKDDGSLDHGGRELCRLTWQSADGRLNGLLGLKIAGKVNKKCGLHIHIDARHLRHNWHDQVCGCSSPSCAAGADYQPDRWTPVPDPNKRTAYDTYNRIVAMYPYIKRLVPLSRLRNQYCQWKSNGDRRWAAANNVPYAYQDRYCAVNFQSFQRFGTFEFRCQGGSLNTVKIESWALVCQRIAAWASDPYTEVPSTWTKFTKIFAEPLRSWVILRDRRFERVIINERSASAHATEA